MADVFNGYVTKYALTEGIQPMALEYRGNSMAIRVGAPWTVYFHGEGKDWHRTLESAVRRAKAMQAAKIKSLHKSIAKMEALDFDAGLKGKAP